MPERSPDLARLVRLGARELVIEHEPWFVYELPPSPLDRRSSSSLVFESEGTVRRVRDYPGDWRSLSDEELFKLSWSV